MAVVVGSKRLLLISPYAASRWLRYPACYRNQAMKSSQCGCRQQDESSFFGVTGETNSERSGRRFLSTATPLQSSEDKVKVNFINRDGEKLRAEGKLGDTLLDVVIENNLDIDGFGACEGTLACSTCHLIFDEPIYKKLDCITDEEMDMLDLAYGLTDTSRLGCQVCLKKWMDGMTVEVPNELSDARQTKDFSSCS